MGKMNLVFNEFINTIGIILIALFGGLVSVLQQTVIFKTREFSWGYATAEMLISAFAGMVTFFMLSSNGVSWQLAAAFTGVAGNMGSKIIFAFHGVVCNYLKCNNTDRGNQ